LWTMSLSRLRCSTKDLPPGQTSAISFPEQRMPRASAAVVYRGTPGIVHREGRERPVAGRGDRLTDHNRHMPLSSNIRHSQAEHLLSSSSPTPLPPPRRRRGSLRVCALAPSTAWRPFLCLEDSDSLVVSFGHPRLLGGVRNRQHLRHPEQILTPHDPICRPS
jgi:hypothetical protein